MIRNQWYVILESRQVKKGRPVGVTRMGEKLVLWRDAAGKVICQVDRCPHLSAPLRLGKLVDNHLACPFHGFQYDTTGQCVHVPSLGRTGDIPKALRVVTYPTHEAHGLIWIWWGNLPEDPTEKLPEPPFFDDLKQEGWSYSSAVQHWGVHYSRVVENQIDVMHLPFIHYNTIGRGNKTIVDGPVFKLENDIIRVWFSNRVEDGTPARKPEELPPPTGRHLLEFHFPNIWTLRPTEDMHIFVAFVPVDEENTLMYLRYYQRMVRVPLLRKLFNWAGMIGSQYIANQDRHVVVYQEPKKTRLLKMGEKILPGDQIILAYRKRRHELKVAQGQQDI